MVNQKHKDKKHKIFTKKNNMNQTKNEIIVQTINMNQIKKVIIQTINLIVKQIYIKKKIFRKK